MCSATRLHIALDLRNHRLERFHDVVRHLCTSLDEWNAQAVGEGLRGKVAGQDGSDSRR